MKSAIYGRVSPTTRKQDGDIAYSIKNQLNRCRKQSEVDDTEIYKEYYDEYISGKEQKYMESFKLMVEDAKKGLFKKIYCLRVDRFGRNLQEMINTQKELQELGISIKFVEQGFDTENKFGRMIMGIMASVAEWQREVIIENTTRGRERAYKENPEKFGRKKKDIDWDVVKSLLAQEIEGKPVYSWRKIALKQGIAVSTLLRRYEKKYKIKPKRRV